LVTKNFTLLFNFNIPLVLQTLTAKIALVKHHMLKQSTDAASALNMELSFHRLPNEVLHHIISYVVVVDPPKDKHPDIVKKAVPAAAKVLCNITLTSKRFTAKLKSILSHHRRGK
jgi:hypothetical protein